VVVAWWHRQNLAKKWCVAVAVLLIAVGGIAGYLLWPHSSRQAALSFVGLDHPDGVAVDGAGNVYVTDQRNRRVLKLQSGSREPTVLPFGDLNFPSGVSVDGAGNVYVVDMAEEVFNRVVKLAAGSATPIVLPLTRIFSGDRSVAVDAEGSVYAVVDPVGHDLYERNYLRVAKLDAGSTAPILLPFSDLESPTSVAVDSVGDLYIADAGGFEMNRGVFKLPHGSSTATLLPFSGLYVLSRVAVDAAGSVYVTDHGNHRVVKLSAGSNTEVVLPFSDLDCPRSVAIDSVGNVYVTDFCKSQVVKLATR
jgi:serine/threonine-protein kinase